MNNHQWRVARYPKADEVLSAAHFEWTAAPAPAPGPGEFLVRTLCLAPGPAQRGYLDQRQNDFYGEVLPVGAVMRGRGVGVVTESQHPDYAVGDYFVGSLGWQEYSLQQPRGSEFIFSTRKISQPLQPSSLHLGVLGQAGGTAYFGLTEGAQLRAGDSVLISAAAGGVGSAAGQIARALGARQVVGISGHADKCSWLVDELGYDAAINYKSEDLDARLAELFPDGLDVMLDNVGGPVLDTALRHLAQGARIALSGFIATQYAAGARHGPANYSNLIFKRAAMRGFVYFDYWERYAEVEAVLTHWYREGRLQNTETVIAGLERMPEALASLFSGAHRGIRICRVAPDPE